MNKFCELVDAACVFFECYKLIREFLRKRKRGATPISSVRCEFLISAATLLHYHKFFIQGVSEVSLNFFFQTCSFSYAMAEAFCASMKLTRVFFPSTSHLWDLQGN
jgi:hypothetical protein